MKMTFIDQTSKTALKTQRDEDNKSILASEWEMQTQNDRTRSSRKWLQILIHCPIQRDEPALIPLHQAIAFRRLTLLGHRWFIQLEHQRVAHHGDGRQTHEQSRHEGRQCVVDDRVKHPRCK